LIEWYEDGSVELYDLEADPGEREDRSARDPEVARDLLERLRVWRAQVDAKMPRVDPDTGEEEAS
jgi:hypothetical protein